jgi:hypothetical protein
LAFDRRKLMDEKYLSLVSWSKPKKRKKGPSSVPLSHRGLNLRCRRQKGREEAHDHRHRRRGKGGGPQPPPLSDGGGSPFVAAATIARGPSTPPPSDGGGRWPAAAAATVVRGGGRRPIVTAIVVGVREEAHSRHHQTREGSRS